MSVVARESSAGDVRASSSGDDETLARGTASDAPRVVLVDDDDVLRGELRYLLQEEGFAVVAEAVNGQQAIDTAAELVARADPAVFLMDNRMPVMGGIEATRRILAVDELRQVVVFTAYDDRELVRDAEEAGAYDYLVKGCLPSVVLDTLRLAWFHGLELRGRTAD